MLRRRRRQRRRARGGHGPRLQCEPAVPGWSPSARSLSYLCAPSAGAPVPPPYLLPDRSQDSGPGCAAAAHEDRSARVGARARLRVRA